MKRSILTLTILLLFPAIGKEATARQGATRPPARRGLQTPRKTVPDPAAARYRWRSGEDPAAASSGLVIREVLEAGTRRTAVTPAPGGAGTVGAILHHDGDIGVGNMQMQEGEVLLLATATNSVVRAPAGKRTFSIKQVRFNFLGGAGGEQQQFRLDARGSRNIRILIHPQVGSTAYAGLALRLPCVVEILEDGTVVTSEAGIPATDATGRHWTSRQVTLNGRLVNAFLP